MLHADPAQLRVHSARPVFQDLSRRRWHGFLSFAGSGTATLVFLAAMLWMSVSMTPELTPLPDLAHRLDQPVAEPPTSTEAGAVEMSANAAVHETELRTGSLVAPEDAPSFSSIRREAPIASKVSARPELDERAKAVAAVGRVRPIDSSSIQILGPPSGDGWVVVNAAAGGSIQELAQ